MISEIEKIAQRTLFSLDQRDENKAWELAISALEELDGSASAKEIRNYLSVNYPRQYAEVADDFGIFSH